MEIIKLSSACKNELESKVTNNKIQPNLSSMNFNADWEKVIEGFIRDGRVGSSHTNVPGHDGKLGFGGSCFPKDIQALINFAEKNNLDLNVVKGAWKTNLEVRPEKDWEKLKGRAVID